MDQKLMDKDQHPCVECTFYIKPGLWLRFVDRGMGFAERCAHPEHRDNVDGTPMPCKTMRIMKCSGREGQYSPDKFRPRTPVSASQSQEP